MGRTFTKHEALRGSRDSSSRNFRSFRAYWDHARQEARYTTIDTRDQMMRAVQLPTTIMISKDVDRVAKVCFDINTQRAAFIEERYRANTAYLEQQERRFASINGAFDPAIAGIVAAQAGRTT